jgi:hypothetical protein
MVVHNFYVQRILTMPAEANPPLIVHADAVLAFAAALQGFEPVSRRHGYVSQFRGGV